MYTKGEWIYTEELGANFSMISNDEVVVCGMPNPIRWDTYEEELSEMRDNAHLIAASPRLYESLKELRAIVDELIMDGTIPLNHPEIVKVTMTLNEALWALNKAAAL